MEGQGSWVTSPMSQDIGAAELGLDLVLDKINIVNLILESRLYW